MDEHDAILVTAVRAVETADRSRTLWSDADRAWASRAAAEIVGEGARPAAFVARRAALAYERLASRYASLRRAVNAVRWRRWLGPVLAITGFALGVAFDRIGAGQRINLLAPPVLGLLLWNLAVYAALVASPIARVARPHRVVAGPLRRTIVRWAAHADRTPRRDASTPLGTALAAFASEWAHRAAPLYHARAARVLHVAAAAFAAGVIVGLYLRGIAFEYRATWESTFLDATTAHRLLSVALWPGSIVTGIPVPTVAELEAIRTSGEPASANAANWLHLLAATVAVVVIVPRLALALWDWTIERYRSTHVRMPLEDAYFQRMLRGFHGGPMRVAVVPYSYRVPEPSLTGLQSLVTRVFGGSVSLVVASPVAYGDEDRMSATRSEAGGPVIALFNLSATPEHEAHGTFVDNLRTGAGTHPVIVLVDEGPFRDRSGHDNQRIEERRASWREVFAGRSAEPLFVDLSKPDFAAVETAIEARLETSAS